MYELASSHPLPSNGDAYHALRNGAVPSLEKVTFQFQVRLKRKLSSNSVHIAESQLLFIAVLNICADASRTFLETECPGRLTRPEDDSAVPYFLLLYPNAGAVQAPVAPWRDFPLSSARCELQWWCQYSTHSFGPNTSRGRNTIVKVFYMPHYWLIISVDEGKSTSPWERSRGPERGIELSSRGTALFIKCMLDICTEWLISVQDAKRWEAVARKRRALAWLVILVPCMRPASSTTQVLSHIGASAPLQTNT